MLTRLPISFSYNSFGQFSFHIMSSKGNALGVPWLPCDFLSLQVSAGRSSILLSSQTPTSSLTTRQPTPYQSETRPLFQLQASEALQSGILWTPSTTSLP